MTTTFGNSSPDLVEIMHDIRTQLSHKGCHSFRLLTQAFAVNDKQQTHQFGFEAFVAVLGKVGVFLSSQNAKKMFRYFEQLNNQSTNASDQTGTINFIEFLQTLQGMMSQRRFDLICQVFDTIDQSVNGSKTGFIPFQAVLDRFDARVHPEVLSGKKSVDQVKNEFVIAFDGAERTNGRLTRDNFIDFYAGISACTPLDDDFFCTTLERCFAIQQTVNQSAKRTALLKSVRQMLRTRISTRDQAGPRTESEKLRALLKWYDLSDSGMVDFNQFHGALQRFGLVLDDKTVHSLFETFDYEHTGKINYAEFVAVLYEEDFVSTYWSQRQRKHNLDQQSQNEEKTQERQYLSNDSIIFSVPKFPAAGSVNPALKHSDAELGRTNTHPAADPVGRATAVFVLGGPGSGKGTQCARIVEEFGFTHLSTGDLLRMEQSNKDSQFGGLINACITEGKLVPMKLIVQLLEQAILKGMKEGRMHYLVDGFPRAVDQIGCWNEIMGKHSVQVPFVLYFDVPLPVLEQRLLARGKTSGRADDNLESIKKRFVTFETESRPVVSHFAQEGRVRVLDGTKTPDEVYDEVRASIKTLF